MLYPLTKILHGRLKGNIEYRFVSTLFLLEIFQNLMFYTSQILQNKVNLEIKIEKNEEPKEYKIMHCVVPENIPYFPTRVIGNF